jgi:hypothetical protein
MGKLYLAQDRGVRVWAGCIYVKMAVCAFELAVSRS